MFLFSTSESVQVGLFISVLVLVRASWDSINRLISPYFCAYSKPGPGFPMPYVVVFVVCVQCLEVVVRFVDIIGGIVDHLCLNFLFIMYVSLPVVDSSVLLFQTLMVPTVVPWPFYILYLYIPALCTVIIITFPPMLATVL